MSDQSQTIKQYSTKLLLSRNVMCAITTVYFSNKPRYHLCVLGAWSQGEAKIHKV